MARERMVTRTMKVAECETMLVDVKTAEVSIRTLEITGDVDEETALKVLKKEYETHDCKVVAIQNIHIREEIYGMKEVDFLKYAKRLDDSRKVIDDEE